MTLVVRFVEGSIAGRRLELSVGQGATLGRAVAADLVVADDDVSRAHCRLENIDGVAWLTDLGSANGTFVNGVRVARQRLREGDRLRLGMVVGEVALAMSDEAGPPSIVSLVADAGAEVRVRRSTRSAVQAPESDEFADVPPLDQRSFAPLYRAMQAIGAATTPAGTAQAVADGARALTGADRAAMLLADDAGAGRMAVWTSPAEVDATGGFEIEWSLVDDAMGEGLATPADVWVVLPPSAGVHVTRRNERTVAVVPVRGTTASVGAVLVEQSSPLRGFDEHDLDALAVLGVEAGSALERALAVDRLEASLIGAIRALVAAIEAVDPYTCGHAGRVTDYVKAIVRELGVPDEQVDVAEIGALLHDVGKIGVDPAVLHKSAGLSDDELVAMKRHAVRGEEIIHSIGHPRIADIRAIVRHHHERWDGTGYPDGLAGEGIPLLARALAVADSYDAITTERPYKPALSHERAMARLAEATGTHFDPRVVEAFQRAVRRGTLTAIQASTPAAHSRYAGSSFVSISGLLQQVRERGDGGDDGTTAA
jgi:HD-GYP domain-containing protein (c-di-GMP phosphodiesterase class II)